ncbi:hypothetical protein [Paenibacillus xylaniclasticus]|uniref:hypothetical protein n=1 Tax=Paenibacillus xylaniclasticus TaxID=588083 RepID=UPI000FD6E1FA|nr:MULTISPECIES: hypothetical protein [Paenibacillus]GFN30307.1 hypothetical protein PCURB6_05670 [Paenibacillus curdlanolyticus]
MRRDGWKWALVGGAAALLIVYGLDSADRGIENVYGPVGEGSQAYAVNENYEPTAGEQPASHNPKWYADQYSRNAGSEQLIGQASVQDAPRSTLEGRLPGVPYETSEPAVNKFADGAAGVLQSVSSGGIKLFVSVFDGIMN